MHDEVTIDPRFNGPPGSANGGYACGVVAAAVDAPGARVSLRSPPPLGVPLARVRGDDRAVMLLHGDVLVAQGRPATLDVVAPPSPSVEDAEAAMAGFPGFERHMFPTCFVCGPDRRDDGLRIFPGPVSGDMLAAAWHPSDEHAVDGSVDPVVVWSALDCPTAFACTFDGLAVLAELTARLDGPLRAGRPHVVAAWPLAREGRKHRAGAAVYDECGSVVAVAEALWIEVRDPSAFLAGG